MRWLWWIGLALVLGVIEILTVDLTFLMLAGGAAAAGIAGAAGAPVAVQMIVGAAVAALLLALVRPWAIARMRNRGPDTVTNIAAEIGRTATVLADVTSRDGRIKLAGEEWSARTETQHVLTVGTTVVVTKIDGATAIVELAPQPDPGLPYGTGQ